MDDSPIATCTSCGAELPRSEMFGLEPDLQCPPCAQNIRVRTFVRFRPLSKEYKPVVTVASLAICALLFLAFKQIVNSGAERFPAWYAALLQNGFIWSGELWRHVTCAFLHFDWWHILMNGFALWSLGRVMEQAWGPWTMLGLIIGTGAGASAVQWMFAGGGIGISGALFGLCGFLWAMRKVHPTAAMVMTDRLRNWILTLLVVGVILSEVNNIPIGNWAHGGGLVCGLAIGWAAAHPRRKLLVPGIALLIVGLVVASQYVAFGKQAKRKAAYEQFIESARVEQPLERTD
ncbi:MAG: rhomboid family intramembrane serine protease [Planctomycetota bacterium]|nr:rhomboid family intramembrane serine protease [Planctomycetota bacterium]